MNFYRFVSPGREELLFKDRKIWFTPPKYFNDPFDLRPVTKPNFKRKDTRAWVRGQFDLAFSAGILPALAGANRRTRREEKRRSEKEFHRQWKAGEEAKFAQHYHDNAPELLSDAFAILCLCANRDTLLMWAHYADSHAGYALEFEGDHPDFVKLGARHEVRYDRPRPVYTPPAPASISHYTAKSPDWSHEVEYRIFRPLEELAVHREEKGGKSRELRVLGLPISALKAVYFGARASEEVVQRSKDFLCDTRVSLFRAGLSQSEFKLEWHPIT
jgi:Protein of unknown function (DUF2971)